MKVSAKNAAGPWGFTLIELLTVIAIISVLATLLSSSLASAKRQARKTASVSNLRQIAIAFQLYSEDHSRRPGSFRAQVDKQYLSARTLACAEDRTPDKNWAGSMFSYERASPPIVSPVTGSEFAETELPHSYFKSFDWSDQFWEQVLNHPLGGIAACQLHGVGKPDWQAPDRRAIQGNVLRALKDGSVIPRQVFWNSELVSSGSAPEPGPAFGGVSVESEFPFFLDPLQ